MRTLGRAALLVTLAMLAAPRAASAATVPPSTAAATVPSAAAAATASGAATARDEIARADSAWAAGRTNEAAAAYERALALDPSSVRALFKLAVLDARAGRLRRARVRIRAARAIDSKDPELARYEARILAWSGRYRQAEALYAELVATNPDDLETLAGRAQVAAWSGRVADAVAGYDNILARDPQDLEARLGLARMRSWQGRPRVAEAELARALALKPDDHDALLLQREVRAAGRPRVDMALAYSDDSDHNRVWSRTVATSVMLANGLHGFLNGGSLAASDPNLEGGRTLGEIGLDWSVSAVQLTLGGGARWLAPAGLAHRSVPTERASLGARLAPAVGVGLSYAHDALDETALLIGRGIELDDYGASADVQLPGTVAVGAGGGLARLSDGNRRRSGSLALSHPIGRWSMGAYARVLSYDQRGVGYFSPDRFAVAEGRGSARFENASWAGRLGGGLGVQQVGSQGAGQTAWHVEGRMARRWAAVNQLELSLGASNSAASSTTGAYRSWSGALTLRIGL